MSIRGLQSVVPDDSFIGKYMAACDELETSYVYDFWGAVWSLGAVCGRRVVVPRPHAPVYMNWYIVFVAESGVTRKSTAVRIARDIVADKSPSLLVEQKMTPERLSVELSKMSRERGCAYANISVSEMVTFLGKERYMMEMPAFLTDLYDCPRVRSGGGGVARKEADLQDVFVTFMSASTPSWLQSAINPDVIEGGFTSRCLFVVSEEPKKRVPWPNDATTKWDGVYRSLDETAGRAQAVARIELLPAAMKKYEDWYRSKPRSIEPFLASFNSREDAHVLRLAACLAINSGVLAIERAHMNFAIRMITQIKNDAADIFAYSGRPNKLGMAVARTVELLSEAGPTGIQHSKLILRLQHLGSRDELSIALATMHELNMVRQFTDKQIGRGRPALVWSKGPNLRNRKAHEAVLDQLIV